MNEPNPVNKFTLFGKKMRQSCLYLVKTVLVKN